MDFSKAEFDLVASSDRGADCHIEHPFTGEPLYYTDSTGVEKPIVIRVLGQDSREFRAAVSATSDAAARRKRNVSIDEAEQRAIAMLSVLVVRWEGIEWEGSPLECTIDNVKMFLKKFPPIRAQIDLFVADRANFFKGRAKK